MGRRLAVCFGTVAWVAGAGCPSPLPNVARTTQDGSDDDATGDDAPGDEGPGDEGPGDSGVDPIPPERACGNGVVESGEVCDTVGASAECDADCTDVVCGDGVLNAVAGEACDGSAIGDETCESLDAGVGSLACTNDCTYDTSDCFVGSFIPVDPQDFELEIGAVSDIVIADVDGDGFDDVIYNRRDSINRIRVLFGSEDGTLTMGEPPDDERDHHDYPHDDAPATWVPYRLRAGDVDGDGDADLVWNNNAEFPDPLGLRENAYYIALSDDDGAPVHGQRQSETIGNSLTGSDPFHLIDLNADSMMEPVIAFGRDDGVGQGFRTRSAASVGGGDLVFLSHYDHFAEGNVDDEGHGEGHASFLGDFTGDFNGDGYTDIVWNRLIASGKKGPENRIRLAIGDPSLPSRGLTSDDLMNVFSDFGKGDIESPPHGTWSQDYEALAGDVNIDGVDDLVWVKLESGSAHIQVALGTLDDGITAEGLSASSEPLTAEGSPPTMDVRLADVGGDDGADLIVASRDWRSSDVFVGLHQDRGTFGFIKVPLDPFERSGIEEFELLVGNFGGSSKQDLAWVSRTQNTRVYIAIAN